MDNSPEELEAQKARAFRPPTVELKDDLRLMVFFSILSITLCAVFYIILGWVVILQHDGGWTEFREFILSISFWATIIFGLFRTLRFTMAQIASDAYMIFPMSSTNVRDHLRDLVNIATAFEWDLFGLIGSMAVLLTTYFLL